MGQKQEERAARQSGPNELEIVKRADPGLCSTDLLAGQGEFVFHGEDVRPTARGRSVLPVSGPLAGLSPYRSRSTAPGSSVSCEPSWVRWTAAPRRAQLCNPPASTPWV